MSQRLLHPAGCINNIRVHMYTFQNSVSTDFLKKPKLFDSIGFIKDYG